MDKDKFSVWMLPRCRWPTGDFRRPEALAYALSEKSAIYSVTYISTPLSVLSPIWGMISFPLNQMRKKSPRIHFERLTNVISNVPRSVSKSLNVFTPSHLVPASLNVGGGQYLNALYEDWHMRKIKNRTESRASILVVDPLRPNIKRAMASMEYDVLVADLYDDPFYRYEGKRMANRSGDKKSLIDQYQGIVSNSDLVLVNSKHLLEKYEKSVANISYVPNGMRGTFDRRNIGEPPEDLAGIKQPRVGYVGSINHNFDESLLRHTSRMFPDVNFVLIGNTSGTVGKTVERITKQRNNIHLIGHVEHQNIFDYICKMDILCSLKRSDKCRGDSIKIYEYLSTGCPIVSTPIEPAPKYDDLIYIGNSRDDFCLSLETALNEEDTNKSEKRIRAAKKNTWKSRATKIVNEIEKVM